MPDVFVPLDTTRVSKTHRNIIARGTLNRFILDYFSRNQKALKQKYRNVEQYARHFEVTPAMVDTLLARAVRDSVRIDTLDLQRSLPLLKRQVKANIAADLFEQGDFSRIMNGENPIFRRALDIIRDEREYRRLLMPER